MTCTTDAGGGRHVVGSVYDPARKPVKAAGTFLSENVTVAKNFAEYVAPGEIDSWDELKPGQGAIVRKGLSKIAAYRDGNGKLFLRSAACTHLGCHLHWNSFERCWDCPCHGSQFAPDGTALNGPAFAPLNARSTALHCFMSRDGIAPSSLLQETRRQLERYETVSMLATKVCSVDRRDAQFTVATNDGHALQAKSLLIATGVVDELPRIEGIDELFGRSVHVCPYCDGWQHRNAPVAVYGHGEKAARFAILLRQWTDDLVLFTNGGPLSEEHSGLLNKARISVRKDVIARLEGEDGCLQAILFAGGERLARKLSFSRPASIPAHRCWKSWRPF